MVAGRERGNPRCRIEQAINYEQINCEIGAKAREQRLLRSANSSSTGLFAEATAAVASCVQTFHNPKRQPGGKDGTASGTEASEQRFQFEPPRPLPPGDWPSPQRVKVA
jgi:hypothetical protein